MRALAVTARACAAAWRRPATVAFAVVSALYVLGAFAIAAAGERAQTGALRTLVAATPASQQTIFATLDPDTYNFYDTTRLSRAYEQLSRTVPLAPASDAWLAATSPSAVVSGAAASATASSPPQIEVSYRTNLAAHARLVAGTWPRKSVTNIGRPSLADVAVTQAMASRYGLRVGSRMQVLHGAYVANDDFTLTVTGILAPVDPSALFWQAEPEYAAPALQHTALAAPYWLGGVFVGVDEIPTVRDAFAMQDVSLSWTVPLAVGDLTAAHAAPLAANLSRLTQRSTPGFTGMSSAFGATLSTYLVAARVMDGQTAMPAVSLAAITAVMLFMLAVLAARRRAGEFEVLRARGAGLLRVLRLAAADLVATAVPLLAAAAVLAVAVLGRPPAAAWLRAGVVVGAALLVPPAAALLALRRHAGTPRRPAASWIVQGVLVLACLGGLDAARTRGITANGDIDAYAAAAPVLAAVVAALVVLDIGPRTLAMLLRLALRRRGAIALIGVARVARAPMSAAVTVVSLCLAMTSAALALSMRRALRTAAHTVLWHATVTAITTLAVAATVAACLAVGVAVAGDITARRAFLARLSTMGLTARQAAAVTLAELVAPVVGAAAAAALTAAPLTWAVGPTLDATARGMRLALTGRALGVPIVAVVVLALLAGMAAAAVASRGTGRALRIGDAEEGR